MKNIMEYKDYRAKIEYSSEDDCFFGTVLGINDLLMFEGATAKDLKSGLKDTIDSYLELCAANNKTPEKTFSGSFNIRTSPEIHKQLMLLAASKQANLNSVVNEALETYCRAS
jgi:predicted HicB family RNase H-like nuclease